MNNAVRPGLVALLVSVGVHGAVLWVPLPTSVPPRAQAEKAVAVTLVHPTPPRPEVVAPRPPEARAARAVGGGVRHSGPRRATGDSGSGGRPGRSEDQGPDSDSVSVSVSDSDSVSVSVSDTDSVSVSVSVSDSVSDAAPPPAPAPDELDAWLARVAAHVASHRRYPAAARRLRLEGRVVVALRVDPGGALLEARPAPSSGAPELLVAAALEAVRAGAPYPAPPSGAGGLAVDVPVRFTLRR